MLKTEYMQIYYIYIPEDIREQYNLYAQLAKDKYIHIYIKKGIYGLKQAAILVFDNFVRKISSHGYKPVPNIIGI